MSWLQRIAVAPLVIGLELVILIVFIAACAVAIAKWVRHGCPT